MNINYFNNIDDPNKAYVIGFFLGDGHLGDSSKCDYGITFTQSVKDVDVLYYLKDQFETEKDIRIVNSDGYGQNKSKIGILRITNWRLHTMLSKITNVTKRKSYESFSMPSIPDKYIPDFIRGYFDSDGCISFSCYIQNVKRKDGTTRQKKTAGFKWFICAKNKNILEELLQWFKKHDINLSIVYEKRKDFYYLQTGSKKEILKIQKLIYRNGYFCIKRKFDKYKYATLTPSELWKSKDSQPCNA